jgi:hypothetical protein
MYRACMYRFAVGIIGAHFVVGFASTGQRVIRVGSDVCPDRVEIDKRGAQVRLINLVAGLITCVVPGNGDASLR